MTSARVKKKKRAAVARNEAKKIVAKMAQSAGVEKEAVAAGAKTNAAAFDPASLGKPARFVEARHAEVGQKLVSWDRRQVVEFTGEVRRKTHGLYADSIPGDLVEYMFSSYSMGGDHLQPFGYLPYYPFLDDAAEVARIMERYHYKQALLERKMGKAAEKRASPPQIDEETGLPIPGAPKRASKPRGEADPRTGCTPGSDSHAFGAIMLDTKEGEGHRKESVAAIAKLLSSRMDAPKAKALAQSWYSTLLRKRPDIYGKFKGAVKEVVES